MVNKHDKHGTYGISWRLCDVQVRERWDAEMAGEMAELGELRDKCKELRRQAKEYKEQ